MRAFSLVAPALVAGAVACAAPVGAVGSHVPSRYAGGALAIVSGAVAAADHSAATRAEPVPATAGEPPVVVVPPAPRPDSEPHLYTVLPGDTLWSLARRHNVSLGGLLALNRLSRPEELRAGQKLMLPSGEAASAAPVRPPAGMLPVSRPVITPTSSHVVASRYPLRWPIEGSLTSRFGQRGSGRHDGIDISGSRGSLVRAAADGDVLYAAPHGGYGNLVLLRHATGLVTVYAHHERILVRKGQHVTAGQAIATVGQTGHATGPHLHFEVRRGVQPDNPLRYLPP